MKIRNAMMLAGLVVSLSVSSNSIDEKRVERGRYLVEIGGCNDCHTDNFAEQMGKVDEALWLKGSELGFSGPWGVSYAANLRLKAAEMSWPTWQARIKAGGLPPMPWPALWAMTESDQRDIYEYLRYLGPSGKHAPHNGLPGQPIKTPHIPFVPVFPETEIKD